MDNDRPIDLRDQFAMAAMQSIISQREGRLADRFISELDSDIEKFELERMERIALAAYKMADAMRKARLKAFG